jgi:hypothetical protein
LKIGEIIQVVFHKIVIDYSDEEIASFVISKSEKDTTKLVGKLFFYNMKGKNPYKPDTLIYHCK